MSKMGILLKLSCVLILGFSASYGSQAHAAPKKAKAKLSKATEEFALSAEDEALINKALTYQFFKSLPTQQALHYQDLMQMFMKSYEKEFGIKNPKISFLMRIQPIAFLFKDFLQEACADNEPGPAPEVVKGYACAGFFFAGGAKQPNTSIGVQNGKRSREVNRQCVKNLSELDGTEYEIKNAKGVDGEPMIKTTSCSQEGEVLCNPLVYCFDVVKKSVICVPKAPSETISKRCGEKFVELAQIKDTGDKTADSRITKNIGSGNFTVSKYATDGQNEYKDSGFWANGWKLWKSTPADDIAAKQCGKSGKSSGGSWWRMIDWATSNKTFTCQLSDDGKACAKFLKKEPGFQTLQTSVGANCHPKRMPAGVSDSYKQTCGAIYSNLRKLAMYSEQPTNLENIEQDATN